MVLEDNFTGDYINASHVIMPITGSQLVNKYIASQGPLKRTISDFWQMAWQERSSLIVMVTPLVEDGRKKCDKYWPDQEGEVLQVNDGRLGVSLVEVSDEEAYLRRTFKMVDFEVKFFLVGET